VGTGAPSYKGFRFPAEIISHCVWLALSSCLLIGITGAVLGRDGVVVALWSGGCWGQSGDLVPGGESGGHLVSVLGCGESMTAGPEVW